MPDIVSPPERDRLITEYTPFELLAVTQIELNAFMDREGWTIEELSHTATKPDHPHYHLAMAYMCLGVAIEKFNGHP